MAMKRRMLVNVIVCFAVLFGLTAPVHAVVIQYTDRDLFVAHSQNLTTIDFNDLAPEGYYTDYSSGLTTDGVTFLGSDNYLYVVDDGFYASYYDWGSDAVLLGAWNGTITVTLPTNVTAVGSDIMSILDYASTFVINLSTGESYTVASLGYPDLAFAGFGTDDGTAITSVSYRTTSGYVEMDNFTFGTASNVPEPSTMLLLGSGLLGLVGLNRRRKA